MLERTANSSPTISLEEQFNTVFPYYLSIGMTPEQFWDGDVDLVKFYRKAYEYKKQEWNTQAYLNGLYTYEAILRASPVLHAFAKRGTKPLPYRDKPIELATTKEQVDMIQARKGRELQDKLLEQMARVNATIRKKKKNQEGG